MMKNKKLFFILFLVLYLISIPFLVYAISNWSWIDLSGKNNIGDALGGITNPIIGTGGIILTFLAFYIQYSFNKEQSVLILQQNAEFKKEQFDRKFFELLKMHSENVKEFNIANKIHGRKTFVAMLKELELIHLITRDFLNVNGIEFKINEFAYDVFFNGLKDYEDYKHFYEKLDFIGDELFKDVYENLKEIQEQFDKSETKHFKYEYFGNHYEYDFYPFDGHSHRLGHYFRHLHNLLQLIDNNKIISNNEKQGYFDMIRSQLSDYEQALLYCNAVSWFKDKWIHYFEEYQLIKNLQINMVKLFFDLPQNVFKDNIQRQKQLGIKMFEWVNLNEEN